MTCSHAQFGVCCDFFVRYFKVVTLSELLELLRQGADISRRLVITFDDGYRDNGDVAAVELRKRGLPACFFIPTGFVGTDQTAWWDEKRGIRSEWMSWEKVRGLSAEGFELGAHTVTHADCGQIAGADALREIAGSKTQLEAAIGTSVRHFAFPYGEDNRMTEENRSIVRGTGYSSCLAANGGTVRPSDDPFRLRRVPINSWYLSPYQFGFETISIALSETARAKART
jgi:peptidoglycan/xylan/chitin deacetylase (PgdA/CDA1 family)